MAERVSMGWPVTVAVGRRGEPHQRHSADALSRDVDFEPVASIAQGDQGIRSTDLPHQLPIKGAQAAGADPAATPGDSATGPSASGPARTRSKDAIFDFIEPYLHGRYCDMMREYLGA